MKIDKIEVYHLLLPLHEGRELYFDGHPTNQIETVLVRLVSGDVSGWGEVSPGRWPLGGTEWAGGVYRCIGECFASVILEKGSIESGDALAETLKDFKGNRMAKAAIDMAWWDLQSRLTGKTLYEAIGAKRKTVEVGVGFDRQDHPQDLLDKMSEAFEEGFPRIELKIRPGWDLDLLNIVRSNFPTQRLHVDFEGALKMENGDLLYRLDDFQLEMIEQPLAPEDLVGHAMLQDTIHTPLAMDESIATPDLAELAIDLQAVHRFRLDPARVGGITAARQIYDIAGKGNIGCWAGVAPQSAIGARAAMALAASIDNVYPADYFRADRFLADMLADPIKPSKNESGTAELTLWDEPGIGFDPDPKRLEKLTVKKTELAKA